MHDCLYVTTYTSDCVFVWSHRLRRFTLHPNSIMNSAHLPLSCSDKNRLFALLLRLLLHMLIFWSEALVVYENANLQIVNKIISRKKSWFIFEWTAFNERYSKRCAAPNREWWCECMMPKNSCMKYLWHMIITSKSRTHDAGSPEKFNTFFDSSRSFYFAAVSFGFGFISLVSTCRAKVIFLGSKKLFSFIAQSSNGKFR